MQPVPEDCGSGQKNDTMAGASKQAILLSPFRMVVSDEALIATQQKALQKPPGKSKDRSYVTPQMVKSSELGLEHYACIGLDTSARGAAGQALNRAMDKSPDIKHEIYKWLSEELKKKFRTSWAIERSFEKACGMTSFQGLQSLRSWFMLENGSEDMCRCGCRGWCSIYPLLDAWVQDLDKLQTAMKCAVMDIQCDWPAYLEVSGARFWNHSIHPCPLCNISQDYMNPDILENITLDNLGFKLYSDEQYKTDVDSFTRVVLMDSEDMLRTIARNLEYNRDARGRHLVRDVDLPQLRLRKGYVLGGTQDSEAHTQLSTIYWKGSATTAGR
eukprot:s2201_g9.t1